MPVWTDKHLYKSMPAFFISNFKIRAIVSPSTIRMAIQDILAYVENGRIRSAIRMTIPYSIYSTSWSGRFAQPYA